MPSSIDQRILDLLEAHQEPLTAAFISFILGDCPFEEVAVALDNLWKAGTITLDSYGYLLCKQAESGDSPAEPSVVQPIEISSYSDIISSLEDDGLVSGLEEFSEIPFIGASVQPCHDDRELLYAKLSGTTEGDGLEDYPDDATIGAEPVNPFPQEPEHDATEEDAPLPEILGGQVLPTQSSYSSQVQDEFQALLDLISAETVEANEAEQIEMDTQTPADNPKPEEENADAPEAPSFTCWTPISSLELLTRARNFLSSRGIASVRDLVQRLDSLENEHGLGLSSLEKIQQELLHHSSPLPQSIDTQLLPPLCVISGSKRYIFDSLGILRRVPKPSHAQQSPANPLGQEALFSSELPITSLKLSNRLLHALKNAGYTMVGEVARLSKDDLQAMRGLGAGSIFELEDTLKRLADGTLAIHDTNQHGQDAPFPYSSLAGVQIPLSHLNLPNRLSKALVREGFSTVGDLSSLSDEKVLSLRGVGILAVEQLHEALDGFVPHPTPGEQSSDLGEKKGPQPIHLLPMETPTAEAENEIVPGVSQQALKGAELALEICRERRYPVFDESFLVIMPFSAVEMFGESLGAEDYRYIIIETIESSEDLLSSCETALSEWVSKAEVLCSPSSVEELEVPDSPTWDEAARRTSSNSAWCSYDANRHLLIVNHPRLLDWIEQPDFSESTRLILRMFLSGQTLEACGQRVDLTRERVRQIVLKNLNEMPFVSENRYRHFFETYGPSKEVFLSVTGEPVATYLYLRTTGNSLAKDKRPSISSALNDGQVPQHVRYGIRRLLDKDFVYEDGYRIHIDRVSIINHIAMRHASARLIKIQRFFDLYDRFLKDHNLTQNKTLPFKTAHNFEAYLDRCEMVLRLPHAAEGRYGGSIRYYDSSTMDFEPLVDLIHSGVLGDIECSAALLMDFEGFPMILEDLDIHNEYELHCVFSKYCPQLEGVSFGRSPIITFGKGNRNDQVLDLIKELSPVSAGDLAAEYSRRYGVDSLTFVGSYLNDFKIYLRNGKYVYNTQGFNDEQAAFVKEQLDSCGRDYLAVSLLKARFKDRFPEASPSLVNGESIAPFGFHPSVGLLVRDGIDERTMFAQLIDSTRRFSINDDDFGKAVFDSPSFAAELAIRVRAFKLVEYEKDGYLATSILSGLGSGYTESDLRDYLENAIAFMTPNKPYTLKSLRKGGFSHRIDELREEAGLDDFFFKKKKKNGSVGGRLKLTSIGNTPVFCKTLYSYSAPIMLEQIIGDDGAIEIDELAFLLEDEYGIHEIISNLRSIAKRSDLYFNEMLDMVFGSEETYKRKAQEWIS